MSERNTNKSIKHDEWFKILCIKSIEIYIYICMYVCMYVYVYMYVWASLVIQMVKNLPSMWET